jgi:hypothetical protein
MTASRFISVHVPKTGGASLGRQLGDIFGNRIRLFYDRVRPVAAFAPIDDLPPDVDAVHGHIWPQNYDRVPNAFRFVFLRHPVDHAISRYFYQLSDFWPPVMSRRYWAAVLRTGRPPVHPGTWGRQPPDIFTFTRLSHSQTLLIDDYDLDRFDFIGFHESRETDIARLAALTGLPLRADVHINKTLHWRQERQELLQDGKRMAALTDLLAEKIRRYDAVRARRQGC